MSIHKRISDIVKIDSTIKEASFMQMFRAGLIQNFDKEINDEVNNWHNSTNTTTTLQDYLGMTEEEYSLWVENPNEFKRRELEFQKFFIKFRKY